ncbi:hypothetical protein L249_5741 [Ophiocordyceps polyrhachis-furcata BCC 54312]|uniref:Subtilisin-like protease n=1 Tax=Ophiocordyceps polyrhachis-furcata BCC 54312 TaxID=1330021 RepID=A0A367L007_9HYPO|nr:hypothetical protein L249_5741 [Ophiocordyceps polyrhachis-furcata BCC 54312]
MLSPHRLILVSLEGSFERKQKIDKRETEDPVVLWSSRGVAFELLSSLKDGTSLLRFACGLNIELLIIRIHQDRLSPGVHPVIGIQGCIPPSSYPCVVLFEKIIMRSLHVVTALAAAFSSLAEAASIPEEFAHRETKRAASPGGNHLERINTSGSLTSDAALLEKRQPGVRPVILEEGVPDDTGMELTRRGGVRPPSMALVDDELVKRGGVRPPSLFDNDQFARRHAILRRGGVRPPSMVLVDDDLVKRGGVRPPAQALVDDELVKRGGGGVRPPAQALVDDELVKRGGGGVRPPAQALVDDELVKRAGGVRPPAQALVDDDLVKRGGVRPPAKGLVDDDLVKRGGVRPPALMDDELVKRGGVRPPAMNLVDDTLVKRGGVRPPSLVDDDEAVNGDSELFRRGGVRPPSTSVVDQGDDDKVNMMRHDELPHKPAQVNRPLSMMQVDKLHREGLTGKGSKIAVIGTGVDYLHPALGGCFGPGCRVSFGADLVESESKPQDCNYYGHSTFTAGLIAAAENELGFKGVAPGAELGVYRVTCNGELPTQVMVEAIRRAVDDGAHIIVSTVGIEGGWAQSVVSKAAQEAVAAGVVFVQGGGHFGAEGLFTNIDPTSDQGVISVGLMNNEALPELVTRAHYSVDGAGEVLFRLFPASPPHNFTNTPMDVFAPGLDGEEPCVIQPEKVPDLHNKIVMARLGACSGHNVTGGNSFQVKSLADLGARYILFYSETPTSFYVHIWPTTVKAIGMVEQETATAIFAALKAGRRVQITAPYPNEEAPQLYYEYPEDKAGAVAYASSWGPTWDLALKPSLCVIGNHIVSTAARHTGASYRTGSSSAPLLAGIVALIREKAARDGRYLDVSSIENLLVSHSHPQLYHDTVGFQPYLAPVSQQGGGLIRAFDAAHATTFTKPAYLNFKQADEHGHYPVLDLTLKNGGSRNISYRLSYVPAITVYAFTADGSRSKYHAAIEMVNASAAIELGETTLALGPGDSAAVRVTASPPGGLDTRRLPIWSGWIAVNGSDGSSLSVPYQGVVGSMRDHQVLGSDSVMINYRDDVVYDGLPLKFPPSPEYGPFELVVNTTLGTPVVRASLVAADSVGSPVRSSDINITIPLHGSSAWIASDLTDFTWDGKLDSGAYPPKGAYKIAVRALRIFGDANNTDDWDVVESPRFVIEYDEAVIETTVDEPSQ